MTIMATHFAIVLGAWRLRVRIDIDEPRDDGRDVDAVPVGSARRVHAERGASVRVHGRG